MSRRIAFFVSFLAVLVVCGGIAAGGNLTADRFIETFDNQVSDSGVPDDWNGFGDANYAVTDSVSYEGGQSAAIDVGGDTENAGMYRSFPGGNDGNATFAINVDDNSGAVAGEGMKMVLTEGEQNGEVRDIVDLKINADDGVLTTGDATDDRITLDSSNFLDEWVYITVYDIDVSNNTYSVKWESAVSSGQQENVEAEHEMIDGYRGLRIQGQSDTGSVSGYVDSIGLSLDSDLIQGTVTNSDGDPVPDSTVKVLNINQTGLEQLNVSAENMEERGQEMLDNVTSYATDEMPNYVEEAERLVGSDGLLNQLEGDGGAWIEPTSPKYVAVNERDDWTGGSTFELPAISPAAGSSKETVSIPLGRIGGLSLSPPTVQAPANEPLVLHVRDTSSTSELWTWQDAVDSQLPGTTTDDDIEIRQLGPSGDTKDTINLETSEFVTTGVVGKNHQAVQTTLSEGFYAIKPEGDNVPITIQVGNPAVGFVEDQRDEANDLLNRSKDIQGMVEDNTLDIETIATDQNGEFTIDTGSGSVTTEMMAYKGPIEKIDQVLNGEVSVQNLDRQDIVDFFNQTTSYNGSFNIPAGRTTAESGDTVEVPTKEVTAPGGALPIDVADAWSNLQDFLDNNSYEEAMDWITGNLEDADSEELRQAYKDMHDMVSENSLLEDRANELANETTDIEGTITDIRDSLNTTDGETIKDAIEDMQQAVEETGSSIGSGDGASEIVNETLSASRVFDTSLTQDSVVAVVEFANGSSTVLGPDSDYMDIESSGILGSDQVSISDFPVGEASATSVQWRVATEDGVGRSTDRATNPEFGGNIPGLDAIDLSTLSPGPDQAVTMQLHPSEAARFGDVQAVEVTDPSGQDLGTTIDGDTASFNTNGAGTHAVEVVYANDDGNNFTTTFNLPAESVDRDMDPGVRANEDTIGTYALTGDGLDGGSIDIADGGSSASISARVDDSESIPGTVHVYTHGLSLSPDATTSVAVLEGKDEESISEHVGVTYHGPSIGLDGLAWREAGDSSFALPAESGAQGWLNRSQTKTTINTYTDDTGRVTVNTLSDPGYTDRFQHWIDLNVDQNIPDFGDITGILGSAVPWFVIFVPALRRRQRTTSG